MVIAIKLCSGGLRASGLVSLPLFVSDIFPRRNAKYQPAVGKYVEDLWYFSSVKKSPEHKNTPRITPKVPFSQVSLTVRWINPLIAAMAKQCSAIRKSMYVLTKLLWRLSWTWGWDFEFCSKVQRVMLSTETISIATWRSVTAQARLWSSYALLRAWEEKAEEEILEKTFQDLSTTLAQLDFISEVFLFKRLSLLI